MPSDRAYVPNMSPPALMTADELLQVQLPDKHVELVRGVLVVAAHLESTGASQVLVAETGFKLTQDPDTVRGPDLAVVSRDRVPDPEPRGFLDLAPDLVVEVLSPGDRPGEVLAKIADWLNAGTRLVWIVDPERRLARVYRQDGSLTLVTADEALDGEDVMPGFSCPLGSIL